MTRERISVALDLLKLCVWGEEKGCFSAWTAGRPTTHHCTGYYGKMSGGERDSKLVNSCQLDYLVLWIEDLCEEENQKNGQPTQDSLLNWPAPEYQVTNLVQSPMLKVDGLVGKQFMGGSK